MLLALLCHVSSFPQLVRLLHPNERTHAGEDFGEKVGARPCQFGIQHEVFAQYHIHLYHIQRIRDFLAMRYINSLLLTHLLTYLLTYLHLWRRPLRSPEKAVDFFALDFGKLLGQFVHNFADNVYFSRTFGPHRPRDKDLGIRIF